MKMPMIAKRGSDACRSRRGSCERISLRCLGELIPSSGGDGRDSGINVVEAWGFRDFDPHRLGRPPGNAGTA